MEVLSEHADDAVWTFARDAKVKNI